MRDVHHLSSGTWKTLHGSITFPTGPPGGCPHKRERPAGSPFPGEGRKRRLRHLRHVLGCRRDFHRPEPGSSGGREGAGGFSIAPPLPFRVFPSQCSRRETISDRLTADRTLLERPRFHAICPSSYLRPLKAGTTSASPKPTVLLASLGPSAVSPPGRFSFSMLPRKNRFPWAPPALPGRRPVRGRPVQCPLRAGHCLTDGAQEPELRSCHHAAPASGPRCLKPRSTSCDQVLSGGGLCLCYHP